MSKFKKFPNPHPVAQYGSLPANTLMKDDLGAHHNGWTVKGELKEDYYTWVNYFEATHPEYGMVRGDFEDDILEATSNIALEKFCKDFTPKRWDYYDI